MSVSLVLSAIFLRKSVASGVRCGVVVVLAVALVFVAELLLAVDVDVFVVVRGGGPPAPDVTFVVVWVAVSLGLLDLSGGAVVADVGVGLIPLMSIPSLLSSTDAGLTVPLVI